MIMLNEIKNSNMRNKMFACVVGCGLALASAESFAAQQEQPKVPYWQDLQTVSVNREAPRTSFMTYDDREGRPEW